MKKALFTLLAAAMIPTLALAQGTISFGSAGAAHRVYNPDGTTFAAMGTPVELWWSPDNLVPYTMIGMASVGVNGFVAPAVVATTGPATPEGATAWFYVFAGSGALTGRTDNFQNATGAPNGTPTPTPPAGLTGWTEAIVLVPEPSTFALAGLGIAALFALRRRK